MLHVTGDTHGSYQRLRAFFHGKGSFPDTLVLLGDTGPDHHGDKRGEPHQR